MVLILWYTVSTLLFYLREGSTLDVSKDLSTLTSNYSKFLEEKHGEETSLYEFPFMVSVQIGKLHLCAGTLYTENLVITAAQCCYDWVVFKFTDKYIQHDAYVMSVRISTSLMDLDDSEYVLYRNVSLVLAHEKFDFNTLDYDVAILKLSNPVELFTEGLTLVQLKKVDLEDKMLGNECTVVGWGTFRYILTLYPSFMNDTDKYVIVSESTAVMQKSSLIITDASKCNRIINNATWSSQPFQMCGYKEGHDVCSGDAGSPLLCNGQMIGIMSWRGECVDDSPAIFYRIYESIDWLIEAQERSKLEIVYRSKTSRISHEKVVLTSIFTYLFLFFYGPLKLLHKTSM